MRVATSFEALDIKLPRGTKREGTIKVLCPKCSHKRTKSDEPVLSISFNKECKGGVCHLVNCHHCHQGAAVYENGIPDGIEQLNVKPNTNHRKPDIDLSKYALDDDTIEWFKERGISKTTLLHYQVKGVRYPFRAGKKEDGIIFPNFRLGELINVQFRNLGGKQTKDYKSIAGAEQAFFGLDDLITDGFLETDTVIITEGQVDQYSLYEAGYSYVLSVPNGSPFPDEQKAHIKPPQLAYIDDPVAQFVFNNVKKVILFGDDDSPGRQLMNEIATRVGVEKVFMVKHPPGMKDANDVLKKFGKDKLIELIEGAEKMPIRGIVTISQLRNQVMNLYDVGADSGLSSGWTNLDKIVRASRGGRVYVITGVPESGKTRFLANWLIQLAKLHGVKTSIFTPESRPFGNFVTKMVQIKSGKRFGYPGEDDRISREEVDDALIWLDKYFTFNTPEERTVKELTKTWKAQLQADGTRFGVLDPFNYILRPDNKTEAQIVLDSMTYLSDWAVTNNFNVFVIVHPTKVPITEKTGEYPVVNPYNLYGSSHWFNATDGIISIWRSIQDPDHPVHVYVLKQKQEELGVSNKSAHFYYDVDTGIYKPTDPYIYGGSTKNPLRNIRPIDSPVDEAYIDDGMSVDGDQPDYVDESLLTRR